MITYFNGARPPAETACPPVDCTRAAQRLTSSCAEYVQQVNAYGKMVTMYVDLSDAIERAGKTITAGTHAGILDGNHVLTGLMRLQASALTSLSAMRGCLRESSRELAAARRALVNKDCTDATKAKREYACQQYEFTQIDLVAPRLKKYDAMLAAAMG